MIIAMSRFRVKNDREQDVRQAFLDRPRFVDDQAGFLGLEVFQDQTDCAVFYLLTRWSDLSSFRSWHSSQAHKHSHELMPKGLKLDSAFTELRILERVEGERDQEVFEHFTGDWGALTRAHLASSTVAHGVVATLDGVILGTTAAMERLLGREPGRLNGQPLWEFVTSESANELRSQIETGSRRSELRFPLTFIGADCSGHVLICNLDVQPDAFALLGEPISVVEKSVAGLRTALEVRPTE
jgi:heme-degrading monooxygenase HmoA